ncbi:MAG: hypothetical protein Q7S31_00410 [bacterium]|nr:hypothetical protein [bacterium]
MPKGKRRSRLQKTANHYWKKYNSWGSVECPALDRPVAFTRWGWDHLMNTKFRTKVERMERLRLLPIAKKILEMSTTIQSRRYKNSRNYYEFAVLFPDGKFKVVVIENKKQYIFYSVFKV